MNEIWQAVAPGRKNLGYFEGTREDVLVFLETVHPGFGKGLEKGGNLKRVTPTAVSSEAAKRIRDLNRTQQETEKRLAQIKKEILVGEKDEEKKNPTVSPQRPARREPSQF